MVVSVLALFPRDRDSRMEMEIDVDVRGRKNDLGDPRGDRFANK